MFIVVPQEQNPREDKEMAMHFTLSYIYESSHDDLGLKSPETLNA